MYYTCGICQSRSIAYRLTRKRNNVEQHIWSKHSDVHGDGSHAFLKYRAKTHKHVVQPFLKGSLRIVQRSNSVDTVSTPAATAIPSMRSPSLHEKSHSAASSESYYHAGYDSDAETSRNSSPRTYSTDADLAWPYSAFGMPTASSAASTSESTTSGNSVGHHEHHGAHSSFSRSTFLTVSPEPSSRQESSYSTLTASQRSTLSTTVASEAWECIRNYEYGSPVDHLRSGLQLISYHHEPRRAVPVWRPFDVPA